MKTAALLVTLATAGLSSAQFIINSNGTFTCTGSDPNASYCAAGSLTGNIIIRCNNFVGQPGNCNDNLAGEFPFGVNYAPCWQTSTTSGDASCSKNCVVYAANGTFTLPASECTPSATQSSSSVSSTSASTTASASSTASITTTVTSTYTGTTTFCPESGTTTTETFTSTTTYCPESSSTTPIVSYTTSGSFIIPPPVSTSSYSPPPSNGTVTTSYTSATSKPSSTATIVPANAAATQKAGTALALIGLVVAYFL